MQKAKSPSYVTIRTTPFHKGMVNRPLPGGQRLPSIIARFDTFCKLNDSLLNQKNRPQRERLTNK